MGLVRYLISARSQACLHLLSELSPTQLVLFQGRRGAGITRTSQQKECKHSGLSQGPEVLQSCALPAEIYTDHPGAQAGPPPLGEAPVHTVADSLWTVVYNLNSKRTFETGGGGSEQKQVGKEDNPPKQRQVTGPDQEISKGVNGRARDRTKDLKIFSLALSQLSYTAASG
eukprot:1145768-Pelagomonas_calceolata.AAC.3